jgi:hypothetical protein
MQRREFIAATVGTSAAVALASQVFAQAADGGEKEMYETRRPNTCQGRRQLRTELTQSVLRSWEYVRSRHRAKS